MPSRRRLLATLALTIAAVVPAASASAQQSSPCPPGQPADRPPGQPPDQPGRPTGRPLQYPPGECNLRLSRASAARGESVIASGSGYRPASTVELTLNSDPIALGSATTDAAGAFEHRFTVPATASLGSHTVTASGADSSGGTRALSAALEVTDPAAAPGSAGRSNGGSTLPRTGATIAAITAMGIVLVALGAMAVVGARRRRRPAVH